MRNELSWNASAYSSIKKSPRSHDAVRNTISNPANNATHVRSSSGSSTSKEAVASTAAISNGVKIGSSRSGRSNSRRRACEEIAENTVPVTVKPIVPNASTRINLPATPARDTLYNTEKTGTSTTSTTDIKMKLASIFADKIAKGEIGAIRRASIVSFRRSLAKEGFSINEQANKNEIQRRPGP